MSSVHEHVAIGVDARPSRLLTKVQGLVSNVVRTFVPKTVTHVTHASADIIVPVARSRANVASKEH